MITKVRRNPNKLNLYLDLALFIAFVVEMEEHFTGLRTHELLGLAFGAAILIHVALHWDWVISVTKRFFSKVFHESRLNYVLNAALLIDMIVIVVTGVLISRTLGLTVTTSEAVQPLHLLASHLSLVLIGLHVALHWKWIMTHVQKYLIPSRTAQKATPVLSKRTAQEPLRSVTHETQA